MIIIKVKPAKIAFIVTVSTLIAIAIIATSANASIMIEARDSSISESYGDPGNGGFDIIGRLYYNAQPASGATVSYSGYNAVTDSGGLFHLTGSAIGQDYKDLTISVGGMSTSFTLIHDSIGGIGGYSGSSGKPTYIRATLPVINVATNSQGELSDSFQPLQLPGVATPTPTPSPGPTATPTPKPTLKPTPTPTPTLTPTPTPTPAALPWYLAPIGIALAILLLNSRNRT